MAPDIMVPEIDPHFAADVRAGLAATPKSLAPKWLYDRLGAKLFDAITELPEYPLTRAEIEVLEQHGPAMAAGLGPGAVMVELGAGSAAKTPLLLRALDRPALYAPLDIAASYLEASVQLMAHMAPGLMVRPIEADFSKPWRLPPDADALPGPRLAFFPGSTIGNLTPEAAVTLLVRAADALGPEGRLILGADGPRDPALMERAYDDALGVTACFIKNILVRINRELGGAFDLAAFGYRAAWNPDLSRIEMRLVSRAAQEVAIEGLGVRVRFTEGETVLVSCSRKYTPEALFALAAQAGWLPDGLWRSADGGYAVARLRC